MAAADTGGKGDEYGRTSVSGAGSALAAYICASFGAAYGRAAEAPELLAYVAYKADSGGAFNRGALASPINIIRSPNNLGDQRDPSIGGERSVRSHDAKQPCSHNKWRAKAQEGPGGMMGFFPGFLQDVDRNCIIAFADHETFSFYFDMESDAITITKVEIARAPYPNKKTNKKQNLKSVG